MEDRGSGFSLVQQGVEFISLTVALSDVLARYSMAVLKYSRDWYEFLKRKVVDLHEFKF